MPRRLILLLALLLASPPGVFAQALSHRGFVEAGATLYPQAAGDDRTRTVAELLFREEAAWKPLEWLTFAGAFDARADSHDRVKRGWAIDWSDRGLRRPALSIRRASVAGRRRGVVVEAGKQFIRWGKADVLNPTDRFAPRDFLEVVDNEFLGVTAVRGTWERKGDTLEAVWARFTPSRTPLLSERWAGVGPSLPVPQEYAGSGFRGIDGNTAPATVAAPLVDVGAVHPSRSEVGVRWNHVASRAEFSLSAFDGFNHLPRFNAQMVGPTVVGGQALPFAIEFRRTYPRMRMVGGDAAVPTRWVTLKGEVAYFGNPDATADEYGIYVVQVERQTGEWFLVGGYAGEFVTARRQDVSFAPDRGLSNTFLGRASYTIDVNRSVALEGAVRRNGDGMWLEGEFSQAFGQHWRATARGNVIRGKPSDFLGRYRKNSNLDLFLRCSF